MLTGGPTVISPIGSPDEAIVSSLQLNLITARDIAPLIGPRPPAANKGNFGHVLVLGGSTGKAGAAAMAGMAALRAGAGLSTVATAKSVLATVAGFHPELMTEPLEETEAGSISSGFAGTRTAGRSGKGKDCAGGRSGDFAPSRHRRVCAWRRQEIQDADRSGCRWPQRIRGPCSRAERTRQALSSSLRIPARWRGLTGSTIPAVQRDRLNVARTFAREHQLIVVLKGHRTLIAQPDGTVWVNTTGNPGMATGGTGDILTGMVAGLIAQNPDRIAEAVIAAVHLHGLAGDVARESMGEHSLVATDLLTACRRHSAGRGDAAQETLVVMPG